MKKVKILLLMLIMICSLAACSEKEEKDSNSTNNQNEEQSKDDSKNNNDNDDDKVSDKDETKETTKKTTQKEDVDFDTSGIISETVLYDANNVKITAKELKYSSYDVIMVVEFENNSDKELSFIAGSIGYSCNSVNGYMISDGYINAKVAAGKKTKGNIKISIDELKIYGIKEIADICVGFDIHDEDYKGIETGPLQVKTNNYETYNYKNDTYLDEIRTGTLHGNLTVTHSEVKDRYDELDVKIISHAVVSDEKGKECILIEVVNDSDDNYIGRIYSVTINGLEVSTGTYTSENINAHSRRIILIETDNLIDDNCKDLFNIDKLGELVYEFELCDEEYKEMVEETVIKYNISEKDNKFDTSGTEIYNENGIKIIAKGIVNDKWESSDDLHLILLIENNTSGKIRIDDESDSFSVNGYLTDTIVFSKTINSGKYGILDIEIYGSSLSENSIDGIDAINECDFILEFKDKDYDKIDTPSLQYKAK